MPRIAVPECHSEREQSADDFLDQEEHRPSLKETWTTTKKEK